MAVAYNESMFHPHAQSFDGYGRGLWQIGGPGAPTWTRGGGAFTGPQCLKGAGAGTGASATQCGAYDPIKSGKVAVSLTNNGKDWLPNNSEWWSCQNGTTKASTDPGFDSNKALQACQTAAKSFGINVSNWSSSSKCSDGSAPDGTVYACGSDSDCQSPPHKCFKGKDVSACISK